jgi:hypothetical protein
MSVLIIKMLSLTNEKYFNIKRLFLIIKMLSLHQETITQFCDSNFRSILTVMTKRKI